MTRPPLEVADIVRAQGNRFIEKHGRWIHWTHRKVLRAIARCRTAVLGGHRDLCPRCGYRTISFNSCRDRHCPKCQSGARDKWIAARQNELLAVAYVHVVFTLPHQLCQLALQNKKVLYDLLFRASAETLLEVAADPQHLGAQIGFLSVLHTWGQNLLAHPHVHCLIPAGGLSPDQTHWIHPRYPFFLPVRVLGGVFRGKFVAGLKRRFQMGQLTFAGSLKPLQNEKAFRSFLRPLFRQDWIVYAKPPFGGPHHVLGYLARYTHRLAITNHRLVAFQHDQVTFRWKDYAHGNKKRKMTLSAEEFLRRFLLHVLPRGFVRIRFFGFLANRSRATLLPRCQRLLLDNPRPPASAVIAPSPAHPACFRCPKCATPMLLVEKLTAWAMSQLTLARPALDSS
ncbi:MAG TPA: IS91 family transposase [Terriglobales bacterium]